MAIRERLLVTFALSCASSSLLSCAYRVRQPTKDGQVRAWCRADLVLCGACQICIPHMLVNQKKSEA